MKIVSDELVRIIEAQTKVHHSYSGRGDVRGDVFRIYF